MASTPKIAVVGLDDLKRDLKQMPKDVQKQFARQMQGVAKIVVDEAKSRVPSRTGNAAAGITVMGGAGAGVKESRSPAYLRWLDFGSREPRSGNTRAEGPWRGSGAGPTGGRFVYPAIEAKRAEIMEAADDAVKLAAAEAGFH